MSAELREMVEGYLASSFLDSEIPARLSEAMRYSLLAGGKRLRPVLCLAVARACAPDRADELARAILPFAAGLEMIHTYSLIHDDLPAMDDDDLRRGKPTCHKAYDEATAILAGDALLTNAFSHMASAEVPAPLLLEAVRLTAEAAGAAGMVGGQVLDLAGEGQKLSLEELRVLNAKKTGALLFNACECGAVLAGASPAMREAAKKDGRTVLYVSHNMNTIRQLCDRCIVLDQGRITFIGKVDEAKNLLARRRFDSFGGLYHVRQFGVNLTVVPLIK